MPYKNIEDQRAFARRRYAEKKAGSPPKPATKLADNLTCDFCGKEFYRSPSNRLKRGVHSYCSRDCMAKAFVGKRTGEDHPRFKGVETKACDQCGKPVTRAHWEWNTERKMVFCDTKCFAEWKADNWCGENNPVWRGGHAPYYGANWLRQSRATRKRDCNCCQFCGLHESDNRRALDVHHIKPFRFFGIDNYNHANYLHNLITLCPRCHFYLEKISDTGNYTDWETLKQRGLKRLLEVNQKAFSDLEVARLLGRT